MKFGVLVLDYDGTIAQDGVLDPDVRSAIAEIRERGIAVIIATGRILAELEQVVGDLHPDLRNAIECVLVKKTTSPHELETLSGILKAKGACTSIMPHLPSLAMEEAILLPGMRETGGQCVKFKLFPRLTPHVRLKAKYLDVQLLEDQGFWFTQEGKPVAGPARTLKNFAALLQVAPNSVLIEHARRGDFSQWIANVFHDHAMASEIRKVEQQLRLGYIHDFTNAVVKLIQERYEFSPGRGGEPVAAVCTDGGNTKQALAAKTV